jgi:hypothetical protein
MTRPHRLAPADSPPRKAVMFWLATYLAAQAALVVGYGWRTAPGALPLWGLAAAALAWGVVTLAVARPTLAQLRKVGSALARRLGGARTVLLAGLVVAGWVRVPSPDWLRPGLLAMVLLLAGNVSGLVLLVLLGRRMRLWARWGRAARSLGAGLLRLPTPQFLVLTGALCFGLSALMCQLVLRPIPHIEDEAAYLYQAKVFASGRVVNDAAPPGLTDLFRPTFVRPRPHGHAVFPPGWPAVLAAGVLTGATWWVNPVLAGLCAPLTYLVVREVWGRRRARIVVLLLCVCPFFLFLSGSLMAHTLSLAAALAAVGGFLMARRSAGWAALGGAGLAMLFATRPLEGTLVAVMLASAAAWRFARRRGSIRYLLLLAISVGGPVLWAAFNRAAGGGWLSPPADAYFREVYGVSNRLGFGADRGVEYFHSLAAGHTPLEAAFNLQYNLHACNEKLWGWPAGAMLVLALGLLWPGRARVPWFLLAGAGVIVLAYGLYWYHGECFGPRFYFVLLPVLIMLTWRGAVAGARLLGVSAAALLAAAVGFTFLVHVPVYGGTFYHHTRGVSEALRAQASDPPRRPAIVLVRNEGPPRAFSSTVTLNDPALRRAVLFARDTGEAADLQRLRAAFPKRHIYRYRRGRYAPVAAPADARAPDGAGRRGF